MYVRVVRFTDVSSERLEGLRHEVVRLPRLQVVLSLWQRISVWDSRDIRATNVQFEMRLWNVLP